MMKKTVVMLACLAFIFAAITACTMNQGQMPTAPSTKTPDNQASQSHSETASPAVSNAPQNEFIGEERAKEIALQKAGLTANDVVFDRVTLDFDDGIWHYEVDFRQNRTEYETDVRAIDGEVLSFEMDTD